MRLMFTICKVISYARPLIKVQLQSDNKIHLTGRSLFYSKMSSNSGNTYTVEHSKDDKCFFIKLDVNGKQEEALLQYVLSDDGSHSHIMNMHHTEVPTALQGRGIAQYLAKAALDHAVENNHRIRLTCTYLQHYVKKNPKEEYLSRLDPALDQY